MTILVRNSEVSGYGLKSDGQETVVCCVALSVLSWRFLLGWFPLADYAMLPGFAFLIATA